MAKAEGPKPKKEGDEARTLPSVSPKACAEGEERKAGLRVSARELVEFSYFPEDIFPGAGGLSVMWAGTKAHQRRQKDQTGETERPIKQTLVCMGESVTVYGRMDAFHPGEIPYVEEMKLGGQGEGLKEAIPAHRAQAMVYAAMVALEMGVSRVRFAVTYVSEAGAVLKAFEEELSRETLLSQMDELLEPYVAFAVSERAHREKRNESLRHLSFPFSVFREGQREMAAQVYTAIARKRRLFASLPTGTGKSAAVLFPALKALGEEKTGKILYLTARTTARQSPLNALERMLDRGLSARIMTLTAREKLCPGYARCHPADCERARGHYLRQGKALEEMKENPAIWTDGLILEMAQRHEVCPFEFALALTELADVVLMDMNYAFDPFAQLKRLFQLRRDMTLLVDEAHHVVERVRENLSGSLASGMLRQVRTRACKATGRKHPYYEALGQAISALRQVEIKTAGLLDSGDGSEAVKEGILTELPPPVYEGAKALCEAAMNLLGHPIADGEVMKDVSAVLRLCSPFVYAADRLDEDYAILASARGKERQVELYCLLPGKEIARVTKRLFGTVFFSATLAPLAASKQLLGGGEEDACFSLPSPFPPENLQIVRKRISTRYQDREKSAETVARSIAEATAAKRGKYIAYFPSYAYLRLVQAHLEKQDTPPLWVQESEMNEAARQAFLEGFTLDAKPKLGLCVLGSLFSEGIDLPGEQLIGAMIVGVGLPVPTLRLRVIQACYARHFGDGFGYACRIPGMQKVLQAAGRVIRSEEDKGLVLLLDERYFQAEYIRLMPKEWENSFQDSRDEANGRMGERI